MSTLTELSTAVRSRRADMGLTQTSLARLAGLSRSTVNQLELGTIKDLSLTRASRLLDVLGMTMAVTPPPGRKLPSSKTPALTLAARTASVSYRSLLTEDQLRQVLTGAAVAKPVVPHMRALLEEAPVSLLASVAEQIREEEGIAAASTWKRMRELARALKSTRALWQ